MYVLARLLDGGVRAITIQLTCRTVGRDRLGHCVRPSRYSRCIYRRPYRRSDLWRDCVMVGGYHVSNGLCGCFKINLAQLAVELVEYTASYVSVAAH